MKNTSASLGRRDFLAALGGCAAGAFLATADVARAADPAPAAAASATPKARFKQGICTGVFRGLKMNEEETCRLAAEVGAKGIDLVGGPVWFAALKKYGLVPTMLPSASKIKAGINDPKLHTEIAAGVSKSIKDAAEIGAPNVILLAGDRAGFTDEQSLDHCVTFCNGVKKQAEDAGVTLCVELLNSKVNHPGYVCDRTAWGVELCKRVNSPRVKLLYDIYHMQIMEGDVIRTLKANIAHIGHFHTAGNPGRHEFDDSQEMNYVGICRGIAETGYEGYLCHEYTPNQGKDPVATLKQMMKICTV